MEDNDPFPSPFQLMLSALVGLLYCQERTGTEPVIRADPVISTMMEDYWTDRALFAEFRGDLHDNDEFVSFLPHLWNIDVVVRRLWENFYVLEFRNDNDHIRIMFVAPRFFNNSLLFMEQYRIGISPRFYNITLFLLFVEPTT